MGGSRISKPRSRNLVAGSTEMVKQLSSLGTCLEDTEFDSLHLHSNSQLSATTVLRNMLPLLASHTHTCGIQAYMKAKDQYTYKNK